MQALGDSTMTQCGRDYVLEMTSCNVDGDDEIRYTTYGIAVKGMDGETRRTYADISTNKEFVAHFVQLCIQHEAAEVHISDLLEDYLE